MIITIYFFDMYCYNISVIYAPGPHLNIKTIVHRYGDSHVKDKTAMRPSYL